MLHCYADGGVIKINPSPHGGTWAWCHIEDGNMVRKESGVMVPDMGLQGYVTNNVSELYALCQCILAVPENSEAHFYSDSNVTLLRVFNAAKMNNVPFDIYQMKNQAVKHMRSFIMRGYTLLDGHPTKAQLLAGIGKRGSPVSEWNVWCDAACVVEGRNYMLVGTNR